MKKKSVEVGNIFSQGFRFSEPLGLFYKDEKGESRPVFMGAYGIGPARVMGAIVEIFSDEVGMIWPSAVSPFSVHLVSLNDKEGGEVKKQADRIYKKMQDSGVEVLYDDRNIRPGEKFADADLFGIPIRAVVSDKSVKEGKIEIKDRKSSQTEMLFENDFLKRFIATNEAKRGIFPDI